MTRGHCDNVIMENAPLDGREHAPFSVPVHISQSARDVDMLRGYMFQNSNVKHLQYLYIV